MINGILLINKPQAISSYDVIRHLKRTINQKVKIGHAGTLDPFASGLLIVGLGSALKKFNEHFFKLDKEYIVTAKLGESTETLDCTGQSIKNYPITHTKEELETMLKNVLANLIGKYIQIPPAYSALKYQGKPLYEYARKNLLTEDALAQIIKSKSREVELKHLELLKLTPPYFSYRALVSSGTYIRSLTNDIAQHINLPATTYELVRTQIGDYTLEQAQELQSLTNATSIIHNLITL